MGQQSKEVEVIERIKDQLQSELREKEEHFNLITRDLLEQLETLTGFFQIMYNHPSTLTSAEIKEFASRMDVSVKSLMISAGNILEWEKIQRKEISFNPEEIDIQSAIQENVYFFQSIAAKKNITVISIVDKGMKIMADREKFDYIIRNLISNGIKFTQEGGNVDISAKEAGDMLEISVEDDGMGIPENLQDKLFDIENHFTSLGTNNERGNGYGLITVKKFIELQEGEIFVKSKNHTGTKVSFLLPVVFDE
jgi:two-component system, sensor histidine kinase and response regulator